MRPRPPTSLLAALAAASLAGAGCGSSPAAATGGDASPIAATDASTTVTIISDDPRDGAATPGSDGDNTTGVPLRDGGSRSDAALSLVTARPYNFHVPTGYDASKPTPLVILLHGYSASGIEQELYFQLTPESDKETFLYAYPDGTLDITGERFWNATDACCNLYGSKVDDMAYINAIVDDVSAKYNVDAQRVFLVGHSNGGFMSHRFACDAGGNSRIAAIVSLAGAQWEDQTKCKATTKVSVLEVHGDADTVIAYGGGNILGHTFPGATTTVGDWATMNGCTGKLADTGQMLDIDSVLPGAETHVAAVGGCPSGVDLQLWTIRNGSHIPTLQPTWASMVWTFLAAHPKVP